MYKTVRCWEGVQNGRVHVGGGGGGGGWCTKQYRVGGRVYKTVGWGRVYKQ